LGFKKKKQNKKKLAKRVENEERCMNGMDADKKRRENFA